MSRKQARAALTRIFRMQMGPVKHGALMGYVNETEDTDGSE